MAGKYEKISTSSICPATAGGRATRKEIDMWTKDKQIGKNENTGYTNTGLKDGSHGIGYL